MDQTSRVVAPNKIVELSADIAAIEVTTWKGEVIQFLIDRADIPLVRRYKWFSHVGYACRARNGKHHYLHWDLMGRSKKGYMMHHKNGDRKDTRRANLVLIPRRVNAYFRKVRDNSTTGRRGISAYADGSIVALIGTDGKRKSFKTMEEAIAAREEFENTVKDKFTPLWRYEQGVEKKQQ